MHPDSYQPKSIRIFPVKKPTNFHELIKFISGF